MTPTSSMIAAVAKVRPSERNAARLVAESTFFKYINSPVTVDARDRSEAREWAGEAAAAEVRYRFA
jgi:hypothetical protein